MMRGGIEARIDGDLVQRLEAVGRLLAAEGLQVFAGLVEAMDVVARVAVGDEEVAIGRDVHRGQADDRLAVLALALEFIGDGRGRGC